MINLYDTVMILKSVPDEQVAAGEFGHVIHIHENGAAFTVEFATEAGVITGIVTEDAKCFNRYVTEVSIKAGSMVTSEQDTTVVFGRKPMLVTSSKAS